MLHFVKNIFKTATLTYIVIGYANICNYISTMQHKVLIFLNYFYLNIYILDTMTINRLFYMWHFYSFRIKVLKQPKVS